MKAKPFVVSFTGVGGSGKTKVSEELKAYYRDTVRFAPSFTREGYRRAATEFGMHVPNEAAAAALPPHKKGEFQVFLFQNFLHCAKKFIAESATYSNCRAVVLERSPFCHLSYIRTQVTADCYHFPSLIKSARSFLESEKPHLVYYPLPHSAPWYSFKGAEDGFRKVDPEKERALDTELIALLCSEKLGDRITYLNSWDLNDRVDTLIRLITPERFNNGTEEQGASGQVDASGAGQAQAIVSPSDGTRAGHKEGGAFVFETRPGPGADGGAKKSRVWSRSR